MNKLFLGISLFSVIVLAGCTSSPQVSNPNLNAEVQPTATSSVDSASQSADSTFAPVGTIPPTIDKNTQQDLKQMDDAVNSIDSDTYSSNTLNDLQ